MKLTPLRLLALVYPCLSVAGQYPVGTLGGIPFSLERVAMLVLGPLCFLQMVMGGGNTRCLWRYTPRAIAVGMSCWLVALVTSYAVHYAPEITPYFAGYVQKFMLALLFACAVASETDARSAIRLFALATLGASMATFHVYQTQGSGAIRAAGFVNMNFGDVSIMEGLARTGAVGSVPLMGAWLEAIYARRLWARLAWYGAVVGLFGAAMLALRREYLLSIGICLLWGLFTLPLGRRKLTVGAMVAGFFVLGYGIVLSIPEWHLRLFSETVETFESGQDPRLLMLQTAPSLFVQEPVTGHGLGSFPMLMARSLPLHIASPEEANRFYSFGLGSHNSFLTAALETGFLGFVGVTMVVGCVGLWSWRVWWAGRSRRSDPLALFAPIFFIQLFFSVTFQDGLTNNAVLSYFALLVAIIAIERAKFAAIMRRPNMFGARPAFHWHRPVGPVQSPPAHVRNPRLG